ncbi:MAG: DEAD/DEAH box helicase [Phenylobacterium sp.]|uniref:DEAD/DEAH box helicase n=1 Tax=Phenylobacterium sp. TaxID=1871053 RepID=UPI002734A782|nr:DEAD/DEAH box helicase [Phenylobacterium sp.]MDP3173622.1 DEAD/DEAH box helicase [Phenylobacterium sp.]
MTQFTDLGLDKLLLKALADEGYSQPTPIQTQAIPGVMDGRDLLGIAQTGTGKTAAFALPILHRLAADRKPAPRRGCRVLILAPTRELATQIGESFKTYGRYLGFSTAVIFGGVKYGAQIKALAAGIDVLVATPGRLLDHLQEKMAVLSQTEIFVLDEADQMLDLGFLVPIRKIVAHLPKQRQNLFFSATMPNEIGKLAGELLKDPLKVSVAPQATTVERVNQQVLYIESPRKRALLAELFEDKAFTRVIVFTRTKRGADRVARSLEQVGVEAASIHGDKSQGQRERALAQFKAGEVRALVATDIAARGIDIDSVTHVVQYELPNVPEAYVHRIGRTARAGANGSAVSFCADDERNLLRDIQKVTRQTIPTFDRRNDRQLGAMTAAMPEPAGVRAERPAHPPRDSHAKRGGRPQAKSGQGKGSGGGGGAAKTGFRGPKRGGGGGGEAAPARRTGVWSNR